VATRYGGMASATVEVTTVAGVLSRHRNSTMMMPSESQVPPLIQMLVEIVTLRSSRACLVRRPTKRARLNVDMVRPATRTHATQSGPGSVKTGFTISKKAAV